MDRPKQRRLIVLGLAVLAGVAVLLFSRQWTSAPEPVAGSANAPTPQHIESKKLELATVEAAAPTAAATPTEAPATTASGFRGRIIDASTRQPVKEFEVQLFRVHREYHGEDAPISRKFKSATGRFVWADAAEGTWRAAVTAPGYQQFNLDDLQIPADKATREFLMPLQRGFALRGRVYETSTGAGVVDAWISFRPTGGEGGYRGRRTRTSSKEDGSFTLDGVAGGDVLLTVYAKDHAQRVVQVFVDEKTQPLEIPLYAGGTIAGTVTTAAGAPLKGVVSVLGSGMNLFSETNAAGQFSYAHLRPGPYRISAATSAGSAVQEIALGQDEIRQNIALVVEAGRSIRGMIRNVRPEQLNSVYIVLHSDAKPGPVTARVDPQGAYALNGVPAGRAVISAHGPGSQFEKAVDVPTDQDVVLDLVFPAGARLSGRVTQGGKPLVGKSVWMRPVENKSETLHRSSTSGDGEYEIEGLPPGDYFLRADEDISRRVAIAGDAVLNIDIPLVQLSARVVEEGGTVPIVGANVYLRGTAPETARVRGDKQTDDFGQFSLTGIEPGEVVLMVYKPGYEMHREKIIYSSPITNRSITLRRSAGVEVRVKPGSRRFPIGFTITQSFPGNDYIVDLWMPMDREGLCHVPSALAGTTLQIGRFSGEPIVIEDWDGESFELP